MAITSRLVYVLPGENLSPVANGGGSDWVVNTGTGDAAYPATNLGDLNPAKPAKLTTTTGSWVRDLGSAKTIEIASLVMHNLTPGLEVRLQGNATNAWGAPTFNQTFTIPAYHEDGMPVNPWMNLKDLGVGISFRFWRVVVVGVNAAAVAIGDIILGRTLSQFPVNIHWGFTETDEHPMIAHKTTHGVELIYDLNTKIRHVNGEVETTDAGYTAFKSLHRAARGKVLPWLMVLDPAINDAMLVRFEKETLEADRNFRNSSTIKLDFCELSRGMPL
jgi:hypothetical protein